MAGRKAGRGDREDGGEDDMEEGRRQGKEEGREQGREQGREEGREQGMEEGSASMRAMRQVGRAGLGGEKSEKLHPLYWQELNVRRFWTHFYTGS